MNQWMNQLYSEWPHRQVASYAEGCKVDSQQMHRFVLCQWCSGGTTLLGGEVLPYRAGGRETASQ